MSRARPAAVTMRDVAARAGVSIKTVSNVLNDYPFIRPETKERVEAAMADLGYQVNVTARNLRRGRTGMIGLALPELSLPYFAELADSIMQAASRRGVTVLIEQTGAERDRELAILTSELRLMTDGLIFSPLALGQEDKDRFSVSYPLVLLGERVFGADADHVTMANVEAARAATHHLLGLGRRRIALVGVHPGETVGSAALREQGYRLAMADAGLPVDPALLGEAQLWHRGTGAAAMTELLDARVELDAVFGLNDALALGALHVLHERRIAVPEQVAVIGWDDIEETAFSLPPLSTVHPGRDEIASSAVDLLLERVAGTQVAPRFIKTPFSIVERDSTSTL